MDTNIVELNSETLFYIQDENDVEKIKGVGDSDGLVEFINNETKGLVYVFSDGNVFISKEKFKSLCVAWLALNYPDTLNIDTDDKKD